MSYSPPAVATPASGTPAVPVQVGPSFWAPAWLPTLPVRWSGVSLMCVLAAPASIAAGTESLLLVPPGVPGPGVQIQFLWTCMAC